MVICNFVFKFDKGLFIKKILVLWIIVWLSVICWCCLLESVVGLCCKYFVKFRIFAVFFICFLILVLLYFFSFKLKVMLLKIVICG